MIRQHHRKKKNGPLWAMLALIVVILAAVLLLPSCGNRAKRAAADAGTTAAATTAPEADPETEATTVVKVGQQAPEFTVEMFDGQRVSLSSLRGKVVLLNFWATWCPPCREELARVQRDVIDRFAGRDFIFLSISRGEKRSEVSAFRQKTGYTFPMGIDSARAVYDLYASNFIPRNFLIDREGRIVLATTGYEPAEFDALIASIEKTLEQ